VVLLPYGCSFCQLRVVKHLVRMVAVLMGRRVVIADPISF
jgi:hypothetical protein